MKNLSAIEAGHTDATGFMCHHDQDAFAEGAGSIYGNPGLNVFVPKSLTREVAFNRLLRENRYFRVLNSQSDQGTFKR